ncbi:glycoside hydrolase family 99-like domain-containing protein [uncultured Desulfobacter sp.]|uniref:glycosyltransferase WbsX family protein n=1 Tax=uncultured Desulfobacter sp. TaxID=240139 RepID=UPI0029F4FC7A|nr:glycoside hydrolase family 99-like domain-containing protein [uncultured Desulfobacter sp.]
MVKRARVIALYLPQYHPIPENDEWWGKGFTEWTNVGNAKPLFRGHYQPRVPADLGYYDLRLPEVREAQAQMAMEAGVEGFMYWHYWFGNGKQLMSGIFDEVLNSGKPDFPFCLGWANHSWYAKNWNARGCKKDRLLIEQQYLGEFDYKMHFEKVLKAFRDERYIRIDEKPVFLIFDPVNLPDEFISSWNYWAKESGLKDGIYFIAQVNKHRLNRIEDILKRGFSAVTFQNMGAMYAQKGLFNKFIFRLSSLLNKFFFGKPVFTTDYAKAFSFFVSQDDKREEVIPFILPNWDHTPRSGINGTLLVNSTPELFKQHVEQVLDIVENKQNKLVLLKSWNEWAEGNYMEPDLKFGKGYLKAFKDAIEVS